MDTQDAQSLEAAPEFDDESKRARDRAFAHMFRPGELVWQLGERYDEWSTSWRVDFLRQGQQGRWMYYRYHYDVPTGVIYFMGTRPIEDDTELARLRRSGRVFRLDDAADEEV